MPHEHFDKLTLTTALYSYLIQRESKSEKMGKLVDLTGKRFGKLVVTGRTDSYVSPSGVKFARWICKCDCGNEISVNGNSLIREAGTLSCGCLFKNINNNFVNLIGKVFYSLTVIGFDHAREREDGTRSFYWDCQCDCGNTVITSGTCLRNGSRKSCGCLNKNRLEYGEAALNAVIYSYTFHAKEKNLLFELTRDQIKAITQQNCFYCGCEPSKVMKRMFNNGGYTYNGIDRIDNSKGYIIENVVPCCWMCNTRKTDLNIDVFLSWVERVYKFSIENKNLLANNRTGITPPELILV